MVLYVFRVLFSLVPGNTYRPDHDLNKCVSLTYSDIPISKISVDAVVNSTTESYAGTSGGMNIS